METENDMTRRLSFRVAPALDDRVTELAAFGGRSRSDVVRLALAVFDCRSVLSYLGTPDAEAELDGDELEKATADVKADLEALEAEAFRPRPPLTLS